MENKTTEKFLTTRQAADVCNFSERRMQELRRSGGGPIFSKLGPRTIRYKESDVLVWMNSKMAKKI